MIWIYWCPITLIKSFMLNNNLWIKQIYSFSGKFGLAACHFGKFVSTNEIRGKGNTAVRTKHETTQSLLAGVFI